MITVEVALPLNLSTRKVEGIVENVCRSQGLDKTVRTSLAKYPDSVHWHYKRGKEKGTLEIIYWRREKRLWFSVHDNRQGSWISEEMQKIKLQLGSELFAADH